MMEQELKTFVHDDATSSRLPEDIISKEEYTYVIWLLARTL